MRQGTVVDATVIAGCTSSTQNNDGKSVTERDTRTRRRAIE